MAGPMRKSRRQYRSQLPPFVQPPEQQPCVRRFRFWQAPPASLLRGHARRTAPVVPDDTTPIMPPARRRPHADFMPAELGSRVTRRAPRPDFVEQPPLVMHRRLGRSFDFRPPQGRSRRGRPVLNEIGPSTPVERPRRVRASVVPWPGRTRRGRLPVPDPEPQVLPPRRVAALEGALGVVWINVRHRLRRLFLSAAPSPEHQAPCPYRPHAQDEQTPAGRRTQDEATPAARTRTDDAEQTRRTRTDECN